MKLKRFLSGALAAAVALTTMAFAPFTTASAADVVATGSCGSSGDNVTWSLDSDGVLTISGTGNMSDLGSSIDSYSYGSYSSQIKEIVFEEGVTNVGMSAFRGCSTLEKVTLSSTVTDISSSAFRETVSLKSIELPPSIATIQTSAFYGCTSLTSIAIPNNCTMGGSAFRNCSALQTVSIGLSIKYSSSTEESALGNYQFYGCTSLENVYIYSGNITSISASTATNKTFDTSNNPIFHVYKDSITETTLINAGYTNIEYLVDITDFTMLDSALKSASTYVSGEYTEESYKALTDAVEKGNEVLANENATQDEVDAAVQAINDAINGLVEITVITGQCGENVTWSLDKTTGILTISGTGAMTDGYSYSSFSYSKYADLIKEAVIEEGVTSVGNYAFGASGYSSVTPYPNLTKITLPSTIEKIGDYAFAYSLIENLTVPSGVTEIGQRAYYGTKIENVELNENVVLYAYAFAYCSSLKELTLPKGITYSGNTNYAGGFDNYQFNNCTALEKVTILGGGTVLQKLDTYENGLGWDLFRECSSLSEVIIKCDDLAYVEPISSTGSVTFPTTNANITYTVIKGSTTEKTLRDAGYLTDDNVVYSLDLTELNANITEAEAIDADNYTAESYAVLTAALETANAVKANPDAVQDDIDSAAAALKAALDALEAVDVDGIKASLEELTGDIEKLLTVKDESDYTEESWTALNEALTAAEEALASEEALTYKEYSALYDALNGAYTGLSTVSTSDSEYVGTIYGGYEVTYNHETDSYKVVVSDDVDMDKVVGTTYVKVTLTPNTADLQYQLAYGTLNIWNFLDDLQKYGQYAGGNAFSGTDDAVLTYNLSIPSAESAFSLTAGTGWTKDTEVFYVKSVDFYNANDELLYTYNVDSIGVGDVRKLTNAVEDAEALDMSKYTEESAAVLAAVIEDAKATLNNPFATKDDYRVRVSELEAAVNALELIEVELADYKAVYEAIASIPNGVTFTEESLAVLNKAVEAVIYDLDISHQAEVDAWAKAIEDAIAGLEFKVVAGTVSGTIYVSDEEAETEMTVVAVAADGTKTSVTAASMGTYVLENLEAGDYTLTISGGKYAPRSYEITVEAGDNAQDVKLNPYGDINGDGDITTADVGLANSHAKGVKTLTDYDFACGDVNNDGSISTADVGMINSHAKGVKTLW